MGESLTERRRVRDEGLRVVNRCQRGGNAGGFSHLFDRSSEEVRAKFVPAAAVTRTVRTLFGITGLKESVGGSSFTARTTGVSNPVRSPSFRPSASEKTQKAAFATGVPDDINAFHRSTISSAHPYLPLAWQFWAQFLG